MLQRLLVSVLCIHEQFINYINSSKTVVNQLMTLELEDHLMSDHYQWLIKKMKVHRKIITNHLINTREFAEEVNISYGACDEWQQSLLQIVEFQQKLHYKWKKISEQMINEVTMCNKSWLFGYDNKAKFQLFHSSSSQMNQNHMPQSIKSTIWAFYVITWIKLFIENGLIYWKTIYKNCTTIMHQLICNWLLIAQCNIDE